MKIPKLFELPEIVRFFAAVVFGAILFLLLAGLIGSMFGFPGVIVYILLVAGSIVLFSKTSKGNGRY